jgi:hypothetical protein
MRIGYAETYNKYLEFYILQIFILFKKVSRVIY